MTYRLRRDPSRTREESQQGSFIQEDNMNRDPPYLLWFAVAFVLSLTIYFALESDDDAYEKVYFQGSCGDDATYGFDTRNGLLEITGSGEITEHPWSAYSSHVYNVKIEGTITSIGESTFERCNLMVSVTIPDTVTSIGDFAFGRCYSLQSVDLPDSVETVGIGAFCYCYDLESVDLSEIITIGEGAFYKCTSLKSITIPDTVTSIGEYAFSLSALQSLVIPDSVVTLDMAAFAECHSLASVTVGRSVATFGDYVFYGCEALTKLKFNAVSCADLGIDSDMFCRAGSESDGFSVIFGDSVKHIPANLFFVSLSGGQPNLISVDTGDSVESIGQMAFLSCGSLETVTIGKSVKSIGNLAFGECSHITTVNFNAESCNELKQSSTVFYGAGSDGPGISVVFGDSVESVPAFLFYVNSDQHIPHVNSILMADSITSIGSATFGSCNDLSSIYITSGLSFYVSDSFGDLVFLDEDGVTELSLSSHNLYGSTFTGSNGRLVKQS